MTCKRKEKKQAAKKSQKLQKLQDGNSEQTSSLEDFNSSVDTSFFYTNDKKLNSLDDNEIFLKIIQKYPAFNQSNKDTALRKLFLQILEDVEYIKTLMKYFSLNIHEFFNIVYKQYPSLFNTLFIKKVKVSLAKNGYVKQK